MKITFGIIILISLMATAGHAQETKIIEQWECFEPMRYFMWNLNRKLEKGPALIRLKRLKSKDHETEKIEVAGSVQSTHFRIAGIIRRWDFGRDNQYAFIINPQNAGVYVEFRGREGERVKPNQEFMCEKR